MLKFGTGFIAGFVAGFAALFVLLMIFGDYETPATAQPVAQQIASTQAQVPTGTPAAIETPVVLPSPTQTALPTFTAVPTVTPTPRPTNTPVPVPMHQDLTLDGIRWRAIDVQEIGNVLTSDNEWTEDAHTDGKFVRVTMNVENRRLEPDGGYEAPDLVDGQGRRFRAYEDRFYYLPDDESCSLENFNPNLTRTCTEIYAVAADSTGIYKLIVNNFVWIDGMEATIELR